MYKIFLTVLMSGLTLAQAQTQSAPPTPAPAPINLQSPDVLANSRSAALVDFRFSGGYDKMPHAGLWLGTGLADHLELDLAGSFSNWSSAAPFGGPTIRFGGTDEEISLRYQLPISYPITIQAGLAYTQTPAQSNRLVTTLGASGSYSPISKLHLFLNPKAVLLSSNSLVGIGVGASYDVVPNVVIVGDWTPVVAGNNQISTQTATASRCQIYSLGLRFDHLFSSANLDLGVTNSTGLTTGTSLTPTLGNSPALYVRLGYRF